MKRPSSKRAEPHQSSTKEDQVLSLPTATLKKDPAKVFFPPEKTGPALNRRLEEVASSGNWSGCYSGTANCCLYYFLCIARERERKKQLWDFMLPMPK